MQYMCNLGSVFPFLLFYINHLGSVQYRCFGEDQDATFSCLLLLSPLLIYSAWPASRAQNNTTAETSRIRKATGEGPSHSQEKAVYLCLAPADPFPANDVDVGGCSQARLRLPSTLTLTRYVKTQSLGNA